jgi:hypothetical protein
MISKSLQNTLSLHVYVSVAYDRPCECHRNVTLHSKTSSRHSSQIRSRAAVPVFPHSGCWSGRVPCKGPVGSYSVTCFGVITVEPWVSATEEN